MSGNNQQFGKKVDKFAKDAIARFLRFRRAVCLATFSEVIQRTPVDTGRLRANWQFSVDVPKNGTTRGKDKGGSSVIVAAQAGLQKANGLDQLIFLTNNLPYAKTVEFGLYPNPPKSGGKNAKGKSKTVGGYSRQAPQGMMRVTVASMQAKVDKAMREGKTI